MGLSVKKNGRPRTPTAKLAARGSWHAKRPNEPPTLGALCAPSYLKGKSLTFFKDLAEKLTMAGISGELDVHALARYCIMLEKFIILSKGDNTHEMGKVSNILSVLEAKFGMTPSDRSGIVVNPPEKQDKYFSA